MQMYRVKLVSHVYIKLHVQLNVYENGCKLRTITSTMYMYLLLRNVYIRGYKLIMQVEIPMPVAGQ